MLPQSRSAALYNVSLICEYIRKSLFIYID